MPLIAGALLCSFILRPAMRSVLPVPSAGRPVRMAGPELADEHTKELSSSKDGSSVTMDRTTRTVPLTGETLQAALKMRCDIMGASYAIYWANQNGQLKVASSYVKSVYQKQLKSRGVQQSFPDASAGETFTAASDNPIAVVLESGEPLLVGNVGGSDLARRELALKYGINAIAFAPYEDGVVECGTTINSPGQPTLPTPPTLPKEVMRRAFEELGALYMLYWARDGNAYRVEGSYEGEASYNARRRRRSDGVSYISISNQVSLDVDGNGPVATAVKTGQEQVVCLGQGGSTAWMASQFKRAKDAQSFGIKTIHFAPFDGGVLEYGVSGVGALTDTPLEATLKMQCEATNAAYAMYWKETAGVAVVAGRYVAPEHAAELRKAGKKVSFAEASQALTLVADEGSGVGRVLINRQPIFVQDAKCATWTTYQERVLAAQEYGIQSICFVPALGGVIEYGTSDSSTTATWTSIDDVSSDDLPKAELERAFRGGATYAIYWRPDYTQGKYVMAANYETSGQQLSQETDGKTYVSECRSFKPSIEGTGPIGTAGSSGVSIFVQNTKADSRFKRAQLWQSYGIGSLACVPCNGGVLEYGTVTKDRRSNTLGPEFQEATRPYRRTVFNGPDWPKHRSALRFEEVMKTLFESGILKARSKEVFFVGAVASLTIAINIITTGYVDLDGVQHSALIPHLPTITLPLSLFTLTSPTLGLLITFRTNACYGRWDNARRVWGDIINKCRSLVRQANTFMGDDSPGFGEFQDWRRRVAAETSAFTRCLRCFLRGPDDEKNLRAELGVLGFSPAEVAGYMAAANRQTYALQMLGSSLRKANLDPLALSRMDDTLSALCDDVGACERIFKTPIPIIYTRHSSRFLGSWLGLLPLAVWGIDPSWNHLITIPSTMAVTFFLLGIEELGLQIEEPFGILALEAFCDASIGAVLYDMVLVEDKARGLDKVKGLQKRDVWENAFELADEDGNGVLTLAEAVNFGVLETDFRLMDNNGNGFVDKEEFLLFIKSADLKAAAAQVNLFIKGADVDGDGMLSLEEAMAAGMTQMEFEMLDIRVKDGQLTKEELMVKFGGTA